MIRPSTLQTQPPMGVVCLGGLSATLLLSALVILAGQFGFVNFPSLIGGVFTTNPGPAFGIGFAIFFLGGMFAFAAPLALLWDLLPGSAEGISGATIKGVIWAMGLWVFTGLLLPLFGALNQLPETTPGFFALTHGILGPVWLLGGLLGYGVSLALVIDMAKGITPMDTFGWEGYQPGKNQNEAVF
jgi:hypothetical protein